MAADNVLLLANARTATADQNETGIAITGQQAVPPGKCLYARIRYSAASIASGAGDTFAFRIEHSDDNVTYYQHVRNDENIITLTTTAASGTIYLPIATQKKWIRLVADFTTSSGVSPTITYSAEVLIAKP